MFSNLPRKKGQILISGQTRKLEPFTVCIIPIFLSVEEGIVNTMIRRLKSTALVCWTISNFKHIFGNQIWKPFNKITRQVSSIGIIHE